MWAPARVAAQRARVRPARHWRHMLRWMSGSVGKICTLHTAPKHPELAHAAVRFATAGEPERRRATMWRVKSVDHATQPCTFCKRAHTTLVPFHAALHSRLVLQDPQTRACFDLPPPWRDAFLQTLFPVFSPAAFPARQHHGIEVRRECKWPSLHKVTSCEGQCSLGVPPVAAPCPLAKPGSALGQAFAPLNFHH